MIAKTHGSPHSFFGRTISAVRRGFTLVELLVVIAIIAILAGLGIPAVMMAVRTANEFQVSTRLNQLNGGIEAFRNEYSLYPPDHYYDGSHVNWIDPDASNAATLLIQRYGPLLQKIAPNHREFDASTNSLVGGEIPILAWYRARGQFLNPTNALTFWLGGGLGDSTVFPLSEPLQRDAETTANYQTRIANFKPKVFFDFGEHHAIDPLEYWTAGGSPTQPDSNYFASTAAVPLILRSAVQQDTEKPIIYFVDSSGPAGVYPTNSLFTPYNFSSTTLDLKYINVGEANAVTPAGATTNQFFAAGKFQLITCGLDEIYGWPDLSASPIGFPTEFKDDICSFSDFKRVDTVEAFGL